jgi:hypothetical protein
MSKKKKIKAVKKTCKKKRKQSCGREKVIGEPQMVKPYFPPLVFKSESLWRKFLRLIGYIP